MDISSTQKSLPLVDAQGVGRLSPVTAVTKTAVPVANAEATAPSVSKEQLEGAVATIQDFVQSVQRSLNFAVDESSGQVVVKVTDADSGDVIRQIPSEEALNLAENLTEVRSLLFKAEA
ncbi:MAG: flagellar protein FlaG [Pseudomonas sp.]|uniref:flagellar protein FlaG n=1 Tax=Pseudomonas sp. TaxID=306 RepID=UPI003BB772E0